ncbi:MAG: phosphomannomutase/phosphoglucomutase [Omnitrophica WOR_2 bacterium]
MSIFKACDIRGRFGADLQIQHADRLGAAIVALKGPGDVIVAGDGRLSTPSLKLALIERMVRSGCRVVDLGIVPTPLFYFARRYLGIDLGVMVTASHNPADDNGFKVTLGPLPVTVEEMNEIAGRMEAEPPAEPGKQGIYTPMDLMPEYLASLAPWIPDLSGQKIVLDCSNGMAGLTARQVWEKTGAVVTYLLEDVDGNFPFHSPNPAEGSSLRLLQQSVRETGADLGIAYDGDADRVAFVDEDGQVVANDQAIVIFIREILKDQPETIIYDQKCSRIVPETIRKFHGTPVMELSGHTYIKRAFLTHNAAYAGEFSGHHFFRFIQGDDGLVASLYFAQILKQSESKLSQIIAGIPSYPVTPDIRIPMSPENIQTLLSHIEIHLSREAKIIKNDGLRIEYEDAWGLVRPSVTEPVLTLRFEGVNQQALERIIQRVASASPGLLPDGLIHP